MKIKIDNYAFLPMEDVDGEGVIVNKIVFTDYTTITKDMILVIFNVTTNATIYNFADPGFGGNVSGNFLTPQLDCINVGMTPDDDLLIYFDDSAIPAKASLQTAGNNLLSQISNNTQGLATNAAITALQEQNVLLRRMVKLLEPVGNVDSSTRQRVVVDNVLSSNLFINGTVALGNLGVAGAGAPRVAVSMDSFWDEKVALQRSAYERLRTRLTFS